METKGSGRWAVILKETGEITEIKLMEKVPPEANLDQLHKYDYEEVGSGPMAGMFRGGPQKAVDGFGYPKGMDASNRNEGGVTRMASAKAFDPTAEPSTSHEKVRIDQVGQAGQRPQLQAAPSPTPRADNDNNPAGVRTPQDDVEQKKRDAADAKAKQNRLAGKKRAGRR